MKSLLSLLVLCIAHVTFSQLSYVANFGSNPGNLKMYNYNASKEEAKPLVIVLHGCSQTAHRMDENAGWTKLAKENDVTILFPEQRLRNNTSRCFNWFFAHDVAEHGGEMESIKQMIAFMLSNYSIDTTRIFVTGLSAGGFMAVDLAGQQKDRIKEAAIFAGGPFGMNYQAVEQRHGRYDQDADDAQFWKEKLTGYHKADSLDLPRLLIFQGTTDQTVRPHYAKILALQWRQAGGCANTEDKNEANYLGHDFLTRYSWCNDEVVLYEMKNISHRLLVDPGMEPNQGGYSSLFTYDRDFHSPYEVFLQWGLIKEENKR